MTGQDRPVPRPKGVRYVMPNGDTLPLELTYVGLDQEDGTHMWLAATPLPPGAVVRADIWPAHTGVSFPVGPPDA